MSLAFGHLYVDGGSTAQTITVGTPAAMTGFTTAGEASTQDGNLKVQVVAASDKITVKKGRYFVSFTMSCYTDVPATDLADVIAKLYTDNATAATFAAYAGLSAKSTVGEVDTHGLVAFNGVIEITADSADLKVYLDVAFHSSESSETTTDVIPVHASLTVIHLG